MKNFYSLRTAALAAIFTLSLSLWQQASGQVVINEYSASNLDDYQDNYNNYEDWIELYNTDLNNAANIGGFYLSDDSVSNTKYMIPTGTSIPAGGHLIFWTDGRDEVSGNQYHASFKLAQMKGNKEGIFFSDASGNIIDRVDSLEITMLGHSRGRSTDGATTWRYFSAPSNGTSNSNGTSFGGYAERPTMDSTAGFYHAPFQVSINTMDTNLTIHFTRDGRLPTNIDSVYTGPIWISQTTVIKAVAYHSSNDTLPSFCNYKTFFMNDTHTIPVVSISGTQLLGLVNGAGNLRPHGTFEYFNEKGQRDAKGYGEFNRHGNDSWAYQQRGLDWITRDEMGYARHVKEKFFAMSPRSKFQRLILRPAGNDNYPFSSQGTGAHVRDEYCQHLAERAHMALDVRRTERCVVYVNGGYWGVYSIREKVDDHDYTDYYYGQDKYNIQVIKTWGGTWAEYGGQQAIADWDTIRNFVMNNSMAVQANYLKADSAIDMMSVIDYFLLNSYTVNSDWLNWNTGWWRGLDSTGGHTKWGYLLWDNDNTFGHGINYTGVPNKGPNADPCAQDSMQSNNQSIKNHTGLLAALRANPDFDQMYISRYVDLMNTYFSCDSMIAILDSMTLQIDDEMKRHCTKWNGSHQTWHDNVDTMKAYIQARCPAVATGLGPCYNLDGPYEIGFKINPDTIIVGKVQVNSLTIPYFTYPAKYYGGIETKLIATVTDTNWEFDKWTSTNHSFIVNDTLDTNGVMLNMNDAITAHFKKKIIFIPVSEQPVVNNPGVKITVFPNPFKEATTIRVENADARKVEIFDLLGKPVRGLQPDGANQFVLSRDGLSSGVYWYRVFDNENTVIGNGKVVIE